MPRKGRSTEGGQRRRAASAVSRSSSTAAVARAEDWHRPCLPSLPAKPPSSSVQQHHFEATHPSTRTPSHAAALAGARAAGPPVPLSLGRPLFSLRGQCEMIAAALTS